MSEAPESARYIEPTWRGRWLYLLSIAAALGFIYSHLLWVPALARRVNECDPCASIGEIRFLAVYLFVVGWLPFLLYGRVAWLTFRARQWPHPKAWVMFRKEVWTGGGWWFQVTGLALVAVASLYLPFWLWVEFQPWQVVFDSGC